MNKKTILIALAILTITIGALAALIMKNGSGSVYVLIVSVGIIVTAAVTGRFMISKGPDKKYDERMLKARGDAALMAFLVTLFLVMGIGFLSTVSDDTFPLSLSASSLICSLIGCFTFVILADMQDAYLSMTEKRPGVSVFFFITGIILIIIWATKFFRDRNTDPNEMAVQLTASIGWVVVGCEMLIKTAVDKKAAKTEEADEESKA
ncbi:MAG: hypothetical protein J5786_01340 [Clostridiales bacterium]|nr:hypothetical protein [Clostridiales bacterium]